MVAIINKDKSAKVYLNELNIIVRAQVKKDVGKGDALCLDDIADIRKVDFEGLEIARDAGVIIIFFVGWRRAIFYDLAPLHADGKNREYEIERALAQFYSYLLFYRRFNISDQAWRELFDDQWFPFIGLSDSTNRKLIEHAANSWATDELLLDISKEVEVIISTRLKYWERISVFGDHVEFIRRAAEHYKNKDYLSVTAILYPRIEGMLRSHQKLADPGGKASQSGLAESAVKDAEGNRHLSTPLLPARFRDYLESVYYADFDPKVSNHIVSRNSVGHGVVNSNDCSLKSATISLLLVDQLSYLVSTASKSASVAPLKLLRG